LVFSSEDKGQWSERGVNASKWAMLGISSGEPHCYLWGKKTGESTQTLLVMMAIHYSEVYTGLTALSHSYR